MGRETDPHGLAVVNHPLIHRVPEQYRHMMVYMLVYIKIVLQEIRIRIHKGDAISQHNPLVSLDLVGVV